MRVFLSEDNICAQNLLKLVSHGNAIIAEILRLKDHIPSVFLLKNKADQSKYQDIILDFSYFKISDDQDNKINSSFKLKDLDDDLKDNYLDIITRYYLLFENIYQYVCDLNVLIEQIEDGEFIQQNIETIMQDVEGKQLLCESLFVYGTMLMFCDLFIPGPVRERLLVAFFRYNTNQSHSNIDNVCKLLRNTGYYQNVKRPSDYPVEYFSRKNVNAVFVEKVVGKLRSEDIYNQLAVYTLPEHQPFALSTQAGMLVVCLFFLPNLLHNDISRMREIVDKFFPHNWVVSLYMGVTVNLIDLWENFKAAKSALHNAYDMKILKNVYSKIGNSVSSLNNTNNKLLKEKTITEGFILDNINKILSRQIDCNFTIKCLMLHTNDTVFYDHNKKSKQLKELILKETSYDPQSFLELLVSTAELETKVREILKHLLDERESIWNKNKTLALEAISNLIHFLSEKNHITKITDSEQLKSWFDNVAKQISALSNTISSKQIKRTTQIVNALDQIEEFHSIKSAPIILQFISECKNILKASLKLSSLKEDSLLTLDTVADVSYAWFTIDSCSVYMQESIKINPSVTSRLRALFVKLASAMEIPLLRINHAQSDDLVSVSQYYSNELIKYIQKVLQIIPETVFKIVEKIIELQTWTIKEIPTTFDRGRLKEFSQLEHRMEVAKLTHTASTFTLGILDMKSTLVGVVTVDPAKLLEDGLLKELEKHLNLKFVEYLETNPKKPNVSLNQLLGQLQKLAESMDGYRRSLEYIQDYINMHGLKIWQKQICAIISENVNKEISIRKGVSVNEPSAGFMGCLARQIIQLVDAKVCTYVGICVAWFDTKNQNEVINTTTFAKLNDAIGVVGLNGLDTLYSFMIKNQLQSLNEVFKINQDKISFLNDISAESREVCQSCIKINKILQQMTDIIVMVGTLQILRKHIAHQLNTTCKFDSAQLESCLRNLNECLINTFKRSETKISFTFIQNLEAYLLRCGIYNPYQKVYLKNLLDFINVNIGHIMAILLLTQLSKLQICITSGDIISKKPGENIDGYPFLVGIYTVLHQTTTSNKDVFVDFLCAYIKNSYGYRSQNTQSTIDNILMIRILQMFSETFNYNFEKIEDKLPIAILSSQPG